MNFTIYSRKNSSLISIRWYLLKISLQYNFCHGTWVSITTFCKTMVGGGNLPRSPDNSHYESSVLCWRCGHYLGGLQLLIVILRTLRLVQGYQIKGHGYPWRRNQNWRCKLTSCWILRWTDQRLRGYQQFRGQRSESIWLYTVDVRMARK